MRWDDFDELWERVAGLAGRVAKLEAHATKGTTATFEQLVAKVGSLPTGMLASATAAPNDSPRGGTDQPSPPAPASRQGELAESLSARVRRIRWAFDRTDGRQVSAERLADEVAALEAKLAAAERERDCGQDGVCAIAPGCLRHWEERARELVREREELRSETVRLGAQVDAWRIASDEARK